MTQLENMFIGPGANTCLEHWKAYPCAVCDEKRQRAVDELTRIWKGMHMSWSASVSNIAAGEANAKLQEDFAKTYPTPSTEVLEQFAAVMGALRTAILAVQPDLNGLVTISASGHANPGHQKADGWSNDTLTLTVYQV